MTDKRLPSFNELFADPAILAIAERRCQSVYEVAAGMRDLLGDVFLSDAEPETIELRSVGESGQDVA